MIPIDSIIQLILDYRYWILIPLALFEGPVLAFIIGSLAALGYFNIFLVGMILILGDLIPDIAYYLFGRYGEKKTLISRYAAKIGIGEDHFDAVRRLWSTHPAKTMFFTKFAYGLSTPLLVSAGLVGMSLQRFLRYSLSMSVIQYGILLTLGYYFGNSLKLVPTTVEIIKIAIGGVVVVAIAYYFLTRYMRKKLFKEGAEEESSS